MTSLFDTSKIWIGNVTLVFENEIVDIADGMRTAGTDSAESILGGKGSGAPTIIKDGAAQLPDFSSYAGSIGTMDRVLYFAYVLYDIPLVDTVKML